MGTPDEREVIQAVIAAAETPVLDLCGKLSIGGLAALLARCRVMVADDSGPMHVAVAVGTPTVGLLWCGNVITAAPPVRATYRPLISWRLECPVCGTSFVAGAPCDHRASVVDDISPAETLAAIHAMLPVYAPQTTLDAPNI